MKEVKKNGTEVQGTNMFPNYIGYNNNIGQEAKENQIRALINLVGDKMAPDIVWLNADMRATLEALELKGTITDSIMCSIFLIIIRGTNTEKQNAARFWMEIIDNKKIKGGLPFVINFISPSQEIEGQEKPIELSSDSWNLMPGEAKKD